MTLQDIQQAIYRRCGYADAPAADVSTRITQWINIWHQRLLARPGMSLMRDQVLTFPSVAGQATYLLPLTVRRVMKIWESTTPMPLDMQTLWWIRETDPQLSSLGTPRIWAPMTWLGGASPQLQVQLWPTPSTVIVYNVDAQITASDLTLPTDLPLLPWEYHWLLVEAGCYEEWFRKADTRYGTARQDLETGFKEMRHWLQNPYDYKPTNLPTWQRPSRLGGMYPSWYGRRSGGGW